MLRTVLGEGKAICPSTSSSAASRSAARSATGTPLQLTPEHDGRIVADVVEFCRILADRAEGAGLLTQRVPF